MPIVFLSAPNSWLLRLPTTSAHALGVKRPPPLLYRRNGRPQACEPCRKRKVGCDHAQPVCSRCEKSGKLEKCKYELEEQPPRRRSRAVSAARSVQATATEAVISPSTGITVQPDNYGSPGSETSFKARQNAAVATGYLGFSSFGSTLDEARSSLSLLRPQTIKLSPRDETSHCPVATADPLCSLSDATLKTCTLVLLNVPEREEGELLFDSYSAHCDGWSRFAARRILASLYDSFGQYFGANRDERQLLELARIIWSNNGKPFSEEISDPVLWIDQFSGPNLRWETLGVLFAYWEKNSRSDKGKRQGAAYATSAANREVKYRTALGYSLELAKAASKVSNSVILFVTCKRAICESHFAGDASFSCWHYHAEAVALLTFLGLHADSSTKPYTPSLASEIRRRVFAYIFGADKALASFTGRPPLLSRRFTSTPAPLDLRDEDLFSDEATIAMRAKSLDKNGWHTEGGLHPATTLRMRLLISRIRDDLFEFSVGNNATNAVETLLEIKARQLRYMAELPAGLALQPTNLRDPDINWETLVGRIVSHLDHLINLLLIERFLSRHGYDSNSDLLSVSFEMLSTTLWMWTHRDNLPSVHMSYAAPGSGVLCLELLKPTLNNSHPTNPKITRSSIIQQLSIFVSFLDCISPAAPNSDLCADCKTVVQHVLDQTLNPVPGSDTIPGSMDWDFSGQIDFNFDLLDTFDWLRPDFASN
ncbi:hypothetical protein GQ53DRAFT_792147 [Thozetella sp. PMI_491]|nr:hypothetical protein GQ53DRAFT_792147 [Thozetella sp. PMI_491]